MNRSIEELTVSSATKIIDALKKMDLIRTKLLLVQDNGKFKGIVSIGDIQRGILNQVELTSSINTVQRKDIIIASTTDSYDIIKHRMIDLRLAFMPVVDEVRNELVKLIFWEDIISKQPIIRKKLNNKVVIMAGGEGRRLLPLTNIIPKPLIPLKEKAIVHEIVESFMANQIKQFYFTVNYKAKMIEDYFMDASLPIDIGYVVEDKPLGTAGSLKLLGEHLDDTFFVSNCDILIDQDYSEILDYHKRNGNEMTLVSAVMHQSIPYGVIETKDNGVLSKIDEKPDLIYQVNTGLYILEPHLLKDIPKDQFFHITHLIEIVMKRNGKVGVFPVSEGSWYDIGEWSEYKKTLENR